jgi:ribonuclease VapC
MVVDTSALLAILLKEADADRFLDRILDAEHVRLSAATAVELNLVAISRGGAAAVQEVDLLLERCGAEIVPVHGDQVVLARNAFLTFGKGRHPAKLNFGDCFSYALAKAYREPLLYKGSDFAQTDIDPAL